MDPLLAELATIPRLLLFAIVAAVTATIGGLIGLWCARVVGIPKSRNLAIAVFIALSASTSIFLLQKSISKIETPRPSAVAMEQMKTMRLFQVLFELDPSEEKRLLGELEKVEKTSPPHQVERDVFLVTVNAMNQALGKYAPRLSDQALHDYVLHDRDLLAGFSTNPDLCAAFVLQSPDVGKYSDVITPDFLKAQSDFKGHVFESALHTPPGGKTPISDDEASMLLLKALEKNGYAVGDLAALDAGNSFSATEICQAHIKLLTTLSSMPQAESADLSRYFLTSSL